MEHRLGICSSPAARNTLVVSAVCFLRESLVEILSRGPCVRVCAQAATLAHALEIVGTTPPAIVLLDVAFPGGPGTAAKIVASAPQARLIVLGISETEADVLAWAEAGIAGYVPNTASVDDLTSLIDQISRGEQSCPSHIVGSLFRHIAASRQPIATEITAPKPLTKRELEILVLVRAGLSNKAIARKLSISLGTTKSHVHNLLGKLSVPRRTDAITRLSDRRQEITI